MKKLIEFIKNLFKKRTVSLDPNSIEGKVLTALNTIIQSPAIQGMEFKVSSKCDKTSVINDIEFCDEVYVHDSYEEQTLNNTCIDACKVTRDAAKDICDATRATCNTGCDAVKVGYDACIGTCDVTRQACKGGCSAVDWTCNGCCSKGCDSASSSCKSGCNSAFPYQSCTDGCNKMSSDCKSGADSMYNVCVDACGYLTITGGYSFRLLNIKGVGTIQVTNVYDMVPKENELNVFSVKGSAKGTLTIVCDGSDESGYYLQLDSLTIEIPTNIYDSNALTQLVYALGMEVEYVTGGIVDMNQMLLDMANGMLADEVMKVINDILDDMKIADANC